jgi:hypothetical protein
MSPNTMLPALSDPGTNANGQALPAETLPIEALPFRPGPGLSCSAIDSLRTTFAGTLTSEHETLLRRSCGLDDTPLGYVDFTGQWHDEERLSVFRPCLTVAVDAQGRRWIAETSRTHGLPGPVWCVLRDPQVVVFVSDDLREFLELLDRHTLADSVAVWLQDIDNAARRAWRHRGALAFQSRQECGHDRQVRAWLLQLPRDSRVYDLRSPSFGAGWPYGVAGGCGRLHRCGRELLFAVSGFPAPSRWADYLGNLAQHHDAPTPAVIDFARYSNVGRRPDFMPVKVRSCA